MSMKNMVIVQKDFSHRITQNHTESDFSHRITQNLTENIICLFLFKPELIKSLLNPHLSFCVLQCASVAEFLATE